jgi:phenylalanyl-tRNA synthetase beta chain
MNISYNWLQHLIEFDLSPDALAQRLTDVGLTVEAVHPAGSDFVLDIDLTSNRPDCLSHLGVAREIGVITNSNFLEKQTKSSSSVSAIPIPAALAGEIVRIDSPDLCHRFTARIIKNVKIGPSPDWLVERLEAIGERSINNVADVTNFVMHELGQPMHSFDLDKLAGQRIIVRRAKDGESITTLDEVERKLDESMLAICDADKPVAVAGVMGGLDSGITENTVNVLLEVAYFKRENIRATSRRLNLTTEASYRFERGVDIDNLTRASARATQLICELAGGTAGEFVDLYPTRSTLNEIESSDISAAVKRLTGLDVQIDECRRVLRELGIKIPESTDGPQVYVSPSWRHDLAIEEDLVEEIARHVGYESIRSEIPPAFGAGEYQSNEARKQRMRLVLADMGFDEAISYSFIATQSDGLIESVPGVFDKAPDEKYITLTDSVIEGAVRMRPTILPGLLDAIRLNLNHQRRDLKLFEIGRIFGASDGEDQLPKEQETLSLVITGGELNEGLAAAPRNVDFYDLKGAMQAALDAAGVYGADFKAADVRHLRRGQSALIEIDGRAVGYAGRLADAVAGTYKFKQPVYVGEINLETAMALPAVISTYKPLSKYPSIVRDVSFVGKRDITYAQVRQVAEGESFELLRGVSFVDVYEGQGIAPDERSLTIRLEYRSDERTLVEDEVESVHKQIVERIERELAVKQRV